MYSTVNNRWYARGIWPSPVLMRTGDLDEYNYEHERDTTWSELFFDLIFVVALARLGDLARCGLVCVCMCTLCAKIQHITHTHSHTRTLNAMRVGSSSPHRPPQGVCSFECMYVCLWYNTCARTSASCALRDSKDSGVSFEDGTYFLYFAIYWLLWLNSTNYGTRFGSNDLPNICFFAVCRVGGCVRGAEGLW